MKLKVVPADETQKPWYADGLAFTCTQCGNCCTGGPGYVWISDVEIDRLAAHLNLTRMDVLSYYCRKIGDRYSLKEFRNTRGLYDCVFLKEIPAERREGSETVVYSRRVCEIYSVRPLQCRTWPFWDGLLESPENWDSASERCPGINDGKRYTRDQIESLRDAKDWPTSPPTSGAPAPTTIPAPPTPPVAPFKRRRR